MLITSPNTFDRTTDREFRTTLFLAGGISNCWDWQKPAAERLLAATDYVVFNPRRYEWNMDTNEEESRKQIRWEHEQLQKSDIILFWFPEETLCPITLLELGKYMMTEKTLIVGTHPNYARRLDVEEQLELERPDVEIVWSNLDHMLDSIIND